MGEGNSGPKESGPSRPAPIHLAGAVKSAMDRITAHLERGGGMVTGIPSGFIDLDDLTTGFQPGSLTVVGGRPSMGKTSFVLNILEHTGVNLGIPVLLVSLELSAREVSERLLSARSRVDSRRLRTGLGMGFEELKKLSKAYKELVGDTSHVFLDTTGARTISHIAEVVMRGEKDLGIRLVIVDFVQAIFSDGSADWRPEQVARVMRVLKAAAIEHDICIVATSQLDRGVERRRDKRPIMSDLAESESIEAMADAVLLIHRPEYYDANGVPGIAEIIIAKNRNGPTGTIKLTFLKNLTRFENLAAVLEPFDEGQPF